MKNARTVILCFSIFVALAMGVLGVGLWRKSSVSADSRERLARFNRVLEAGLDDFVMLTSSQGDEAIAEADELRYAVADDPGMAADLAEWLADRRAVRAAVADKLWQLDTLRRASPDRTWPEKNRALPRAAPSAN